MRMPHFSRRHFFFGAMAAPALSTQVRAQAKPLNIAFIGTGNRGGFLLRTAMTSAGTRVAAICDTKPDRLDTAASAAAKDKPKTYRDYKQLLADPNVEAVHIATPCDLHVEMAIAALEAGKHVYCEKPVGIQAAEIVRLVAAVKKHPKLVFQVGQQMRSIKFRQALVEKIRSGAAGDIIMVKAQRHAAEDLDHTGSSSDWFFDAKRSGDVLVEMSVHNLDQINWVVGEAPAMAAGFGGVLKWKDQPKGRTSMDGYTLSYEYPGGVKMSYTQVFFHPQGLPNGGAYTLVYTTKGAVDLDSGKFYPDARNAQPVTLVEQPTAREDMNKAHLDAFYAAVRGQGKPPAGIMEGATGALTAIMGREAISQKRVVTWKEMGLTV